MSRITVNTTGTQPTLLISTDIPVDPSTGTITAPLNVTCLQDVTVTNSTGIFSWTDFCSTDTSKITTPADNEISTNMVIDGEKFFGTGAGSDAAGLGIAGMSQDKVKVYFKLILNGDDSTSDAFWYTGVGYISSIAPTVAADSPVWVSPMSIAVDGRLYPGQNPTV